MSRSVVVTGIGVVSPFGASKEQLRDALLAGDSGIAPITAFDVSACRTRMGATVKGFDATTWIPPMKLRRMDDTARYAVVVARQAFVDAGYATAADGDDQMGIILGTFTAGGQATSEYLTALHRGGPTGAPALLFNSTVANAPASLAGLEFKLRGPNVTVSQKEASGLAAIVMAVDAIRLGRSRAIAAGGVDAIFDIFFRVHDRFAVMAPGDCDTVRGPFDHERAGFVLGEGGYAVLLESDSDAPRDSARGYAEIVGVSAHSAAVAINAWPGDTEPLVRTMQGALEDAQIGPEVVDVVYASANGSALDSVEAAAIHQALGDRPVVTSIKGALGECGASGAASVVAALSCGAVGAVPPVAHLGVPDSATCRLNLARTRLPLPGPVALINSFGSGGSMFSLVLRVRQ
jgi:3-oxoacyl-[acyl-carrier-protein] synthase II